MFKRTKVSAAVALALGGLALSAPPAFAQQQLERVEITGSAVRRIDAEAALPVQILRREDIERSGAATTTDLLQRLSVVQNSTGEASAVGGATGGFTGVSIHNIGENRTLVLLNGRRLVQFGGQTLTGFGAAVDLNSIPISAIDRVEILTDGASALYGSDAIAGVVNFITKRNTTEGDVTIGISAPEGGAVETRISASKGFGTLENNGWNVFLAISADKRNRLDAVDREFSKTGVINFVHEGQAYQAFLGSPRAIPANATDDAGNVINPYFLANGACAPGNVRLFDPASGTTACYFDFVAQLETFPIRERQNVLASGSLKLGDNHTLTADIMLSKNEQISRIAPVPGDVPIPAGGALHNTYLAPLGITGDSTAFYRAADLGKRENTDEAEFTNFNVGLQGLFAGWDYNASYGHSESTSRQFISGYPGALAFNRLLEGGLIDPFLQPGQQSAAGLAALNAAAFNGYWDGGKAKLDTIDLKASREMFALPAGPVLFGAGISYYKEKFNNAPSLFAQGLTADPVTGTLCDPVNAPALCETRFGDLAATTLYGADRDVYGLFAELVVPVFKGFELTGSVRYDKYSDVGDSTTGKLSFRWNPVQSILLRGSVGTGFKAPTVPQLRAPRQPFGVTNGDYVCTPELAQVAAAAGAECRDGDVQYDQTAGGNPDLTPEKSRQASLGVRFEPTNTISLGVDYWWVGIEDAFGQLTEEEAFANPLTYPNNWGAQFDPSSQRTFVAFFAGNQNLGKEYYAGLDFDLQGRLNTPFGNLRSQLLATYFLREQRQLSAGGPYFSSIGNNAELGVVTFRWKGKWINSLQVGNWTHTLGLNFQSGYLDAEAFPELLDASGNPTGVFSDGIRLKVDPYYTLDWQTQWAFRKNMILTAGVLNFLDEEPPLSLAEGGLNKGQMFGYDDRYYDVRGRTIYASFTFKF